MRREVQITPQDALRKLGVRRREDIKGITRAIEIISYYPESFSAAFLVLLSREQRSDELDYVYLVEFKVDDGKIKLAAPPKSSLLSGAIELFVDTEAGSWDDFELITGKLEYPPQRVVAQRFRDCGVSFTEIREIVAQFNNAAIERDALE